MFYLVSYDIEDDKKRDRACKFLKDLGYHTQKSVFLIPCEDASQAQDIYRRVLEYACANTDRVLMVPLCSSCLAKMVTKGDQPQFSQEVWIF